MILLQVSDPSHQGSFFDLKTLGSLAGASLAVGLVCNAAQTVFNFNPKWLALTIAIVYSYCLVFITGEETPTNLLLAFFNGLLIWSTATGANVITGKGSDGFTTQIGRRRGFFDSWF